MERLEERKLHVGLNQATEPVVTACWPRAQSLEAVTHRACGLRRHQCRPYPPPESASVSMTSPMSPTIYLDSHDDRKCRASGRSATAAASGTGGAAISVNQSSWMGWLWLPAACWRLLLLRQIVRFVVCGRKWLRFDSSGAPCARCNEPISASSCSGPSASSGSSSSGSSPPANDDAAAAAARCCLGFRKDACTSSSSLWVLLWSDALPPAAAPPDVAAAALLLASPCVMARPSCGRACCSHTADFVRSAAYTLPPLDLDVPQAA
jgi:hypothetical protein